MRKFIMSDIHGFGNVYYSMMNYIDNINRFEEVELYINGDLIDRGYESAEILLDIKKRIEENKYKIVYLGGNHELMMHEVFEKRKKNSYVSNFNDWFLNGGYVTDYGLCDLLSDKTKLFEVVEFVSNLNIYHEFEEKINNKNILLVHAACPSDIKNHLDLKIKDNNKIVLESVWTRYNPFAAKNNIGNGNYFTIIGHTPNNNKFGYSFHQIQNYLNIDGGCSMYITGKYTYNHFPLVEVRDNYLKILTFNSNNEIIYGNYFNGDKLQSYSKNELKSARSYLNHKLKMHKLSSKYDEVVLFENAIKKLQKKL